MPADRVGRCCLLLCLAALWKRTACTTHVQLNELDLLFKEPTFPPTVAPATAATAAAMAMATAGGSSAPRGGGIPFPAIGGGGGGSGGSAR